MASAIEFDFYSKLPLWLTTLHKYRMKKFDTPLTTLKLSYKKCFLSHITCLIYTNCYFVENFFLTYGYNNFHFGGMGTIITMVTEILYVN